MLYYHGNGNYNLLLYGFDGHTWSLWHKVSSVIMLPLLVLHIFRGRNLFQKGTGWTSWVKNLFTGKIKGRYKRSNVFLFVISFLCISTALASWLIFPGSAVAAGLRGIHNKFGLLFILLCLIHLFNYWRVVVGQVKKRG